MTEPRILTCTSVESLFFKFINGKIEPLNFFNGNEHEFVVFPLGVYSLETTKDHKLNYNNNNVYKNALFDYKQVLKNQKDIATANDFSADGTTTVKLNSFIELEDDDEEDESMLVDIPETDEQKEVPLVQETLDVNAKIEETLSVLEFDKKTINYAYFKTPAFSQLNETEKITVIINALFNNSEFEQLDNDGILKKIAEFLTNSGMKDDEFDAAEKVLLENVTEFKKSRKTEIEEA